MLTTSITAVKQWVREILDKTDLTEADVKEYTGEIKEIGPVTVDWPKSIGYFRGVALAVATGVIEPPLGLFIAAIPFLKFLKRPNASWPERAISSVIEGAAKPVGGDADATIRPISPAGASR